MAFWHRNLGRQWHGRSLLVVWTALAVACGSPVASNGGTDPAPDTTGEDANPGTDASGEDANPGTDAVTADTSNGSDTGGEDTAADVADTLDAIAPDTLVDVGDATADAAPDVADILDAIAPDTVGDVGDAVADAGVADSATGDAASDVADTLDAGTQDSLGDSVNDTADAAPDVADSANSDSTADAAADASSALGAATLTVQDQVLDKIYNQVVITEVAMPTSGLNAGKLRISEEVAGAAGTLAGESVVPQGKLNVGMVVTLTKAIVGQKGFFAELLDNKGKPVLGADGAPLTATFKVTGDTVDPAVVVQNQDLPASDLATLTLGLVRIPERFTAGAWVAIYADNAGKIGALLGKAKFTVGDHADAPLPLVSNLLKGQILHAVMREGAALTGSWTANSPVVPYLSGQPVDTSFAVDSEAFQPELEIDDQTLSDPKKLLIKHVVIPKAYFGGWLAIYADNAGAQGDLLGKLYYTTGTKDNQTLTLTVPQQGEKTLHAVLYAGQTWDVATNVVMPSPGGGEMKVTVQIGAQPLSYVIAEPYTTDNPRHVMVTRAYSYNKPAWVVLARDDNGQPGVVLARKKVLPKFAGNVHLWNLTGDFLEGGTLPEYLTGMLGTFRRGAKGVDKLHVLLYEDFPSDNQFTYAPGGTEDVPVLDANGIAIDTPLTVTVKSSIQNVQQESPRYYFPCPLSQQIYNATKLPVDCRCHVNIVGLDFPECKADIADGLGMQIGTGPRARTHNFGGFHSGFAETATNELIAVMSWKDEKTKWPENDITIDVGAIMGINLDTRERRIIGGRFEDPTTGIQEKGTGPVLSYPFQVQKGPDGKYYVASYGYVRIDNSLVPTVDVIRMDPATGNREYAWRSNHLGYNFDNQVNPYGHCGNGRTEKYGYYSVQVGRKAFGMDDQGNFFLSYAHNGNTPTSDGIGILKISADGKKCDFVTRTKVGVDNVLYQGQSIGAGVEPQAGPYKGMLVKDGKIYTSTELNDELYEIDVATGDRKMVHKDGVTDANNGSSGTHVIWDAHRNLIWQAGLSGSTLMFDPAKGTSEPLWCPENVRDYFGIACLKPAAWGNNGLPMERGIWMHPTDPEYLFVVNLTMIMRVHLMSGTSEIFSY